MGIKSPLHTLARPLVQASVRSLSSILSASTEGNAEMAKPKLKKLPLQGRVKKAQCQAPKLDAEGKSKKQRTREKKAQKAIVKTEQTQIHQERKDKDFAQAVAVSHPKLEDAAEDIESVQRPAPTSTAFVAKETPVTVTENERSLSALCQPLPNHQAILEGPIEIGKTFKLPIRSKASLYGKDEANSNKIIDQDVAEPLQTPSPRSVNDLHKDSQPSICVTPARLHDSKVDGFDDSPASSTSTQTLLGDAPDTVGAEVHEPQTPMTADAIQDNDLGTPNKDELHSEAGTFNEVVSPHDRHTHSQNDGCSESSSMDDPDSQHSTKTLDADANRDSSFSEGLWINPAIHISAETQYPFYTSAHELDDRLIDVNAIADHVSEDASPTSFSDNVCVTSCPSLVSRSQYEAGVTADEDLPERYRSDGPDEEQSSDPPLIADTMDAEASKAQLTDPNNVQKAITGEALGPGAEDEQLEGEQVNDQELESHSASATLSTSLASVGHVEALIAHDTVTTSSEHGELMRDNPIDTQPPGSACTELVAFQAPTVQPSVQSAAAPVILSNGSVKKQTEPKQEKEDELETWADLYLPGKSSAGTRPPPSLRAEVFQKLALMGWEGALPWESV